MPTKEVKSFRLSAQTREIVRQMAEEEQRSEAQIVEFAVSERKAGQNKEKNPEIAVGDQFREYFNRVEDLNRYQLDDLLDAIHVRRLHLMRAEMEQYGVRSSCDFRGTTTRYLLVYDPAPNSAEAEWANLEECRRLLDTLRNLPPAAAFARWRVKVAPLAKREYTRNDARRDILAERAELRRRYDANEIDGEMFNDMMKASGSYMDLVE
jgi:hypothetical protein